MSKTKRETKCPTGPRVVGGLIHWRKGMMLGVVEKPPAELLLVVPYHPDVAPLARKFALGTHDENEPLNYFADDDEGGVLPWRYVYYWIPWADICPSELVPAKPKKGKR